MVRVGVFHYKMTLRRYMKFVLIIAALTNSRLLTNLCFKKEVIFECQSVELKSE